MPEYTQGQKSVVIRRMARECKNPIDRRIMEEAAREYEASALAEARARDDPEPSLVPQAG